MKETEDVIVRYKDRDHPYNGEFLSDVIGKLRTVIRAERMRWKDANHEQPLAISFSEDDYFLLLQAYREARYDATQPTPEGGFRYMGIPAQIDRRLNLGEVRI